MINFALSTSCHQVWADVMMFDENREPTNFEKYICMSATRRDRFEYVYSDAEIKEKYHDLVVNEWYMPYVYELTVKHDYSLLHK